MKRVSLIFQARLTLLAKKQTIGSKFEPSVVFSLLEQYLIALPNPVIPFDSLLALVTPNGLHSVTPHPLISRYSRCIT